MSTYGRVDREQTLEHKAHHPCQDFRYLDDSILQLLSLSGEMMLEKDTQADNKACDAIGNGQKDRSSRLEYVSLRSNNFVKLVLSR